MSGSDARNGCEAEKTGADAALPVAAEECSELLAPLARFGAVILAVSGGVDSMTLLHLVGAWARAGGTGKPRVLVATVDHGLRPQSASEAKFVQDAAGRLGLEHVTLPWTGVKPATGIQDAARKARYRLLADVARSFAGGARVAVVTAHTADDQAETVLMRMARGTGLDGLAGMSAERSIDPSGDVALLRPLLSVSRARLARTLEQMGGSHIIDPSNEDSRFERPRLRQMRHALDGIGLTTGQLVATARRAARARTALEVATRELAQRLSIELNSGAYASLAIEPLLAAPAELQVRLLSRLVEAYGGQGVPPRLARLEALVAGMSRPGWRGQTLGGAVVERQRDRLRIRREPKVQRLPPQPLSEGHAIDWDNRFRIECPAVIAGTVTALGRNAAIGLRRSHAESGAEPLPVAIMATLPSLWRGDELVAAPVLTASGLSLKSLTNGGHGPCRVTFLDHGLMRAWNLGRVAQT